MGIAHSRTMPHLTGESIGSGSGSSPNEQTPFIPPYDYYEFEWFWILVLTITLSALAAIIFVLVVASQIGGAYLQIITAVLWILIPSFSYSAVFVTISRFHTTLGTCIERYLNVSRQKQRTALRVLAWCWLPFIIAAMFATEILILRSTP